MLLLLLKASVSKQIHARFKALLVSIDDKTSRRRSRSAHSSSNSASRLPPAGRDVPYCVASRTEPVVFTTWRAMALMPYTNPLTTFAYKFKIHIQAPSLYLKVLSSRARSTSSFLPSLSLSIILSLGVHPYRQE